MGVEETKNEKSINLKNNDTFSQKNPQIKQKTKKCYQFLISDEELICTKTELFKGQTICDKLRQIKFFFLNIINKKIDARIAIKKSKFIKGFASKKTVIIYFLEIIQ